MGKNTSKKVLADNVSMPLVIQIINFMKHKNTRSPLALKSQEEVEFLALLNFVDFVYNGYNVVNGRTTVQKIIFATEHFMKFR